MNVQVKDKPDIFLYQNGQDRFNNTREKFGEIRVLTEKLTSPLMPEDFVAQPVIDVSPPKWHLGHTTWFFEEFVLRKYKQDYKLFDKDFRFLFNSYYDSIGERVKRQQRGNLTRPPLEKVFEYRNYVDHHLLAFLSSGNLPEEIYQIIELGLQHEQQHQELIMTDIKYILSRNPLLPSYLEKEPAISTELLPRAVKYLSVDEGIYHIGYNGNDFCFDNELGYHKVYLQAFKVMDRLVTNREYLEFIEDGAYARFDFWLSEGWEWVRLNEVKAPLYWQQIEGEWYQFTHYGLRKINMDEPVTHVNYFEADAFATWAGKRLLNEFEWEIAAQIYSPEIPASANMLNNGIYIPQNKAPNNYQFFGDNWEWTQSAYLPYPYYKKQNGALGEYNGKFMISQMVLRGGSCVTPVDHIRHTYRNFFHPHLQWQFSGIRLAENI